MTSGRFTVMVVAAALVAVVALLASGVFGGGDDDDGDSSSGEPAATVQEEKPAPPDEEKPGEPEEPEPGQPVPEEPAKTEVPPNPDEVHGNDDFALTRPGNLSRALAVLDRRRQRVEGVFEGIRVAPGRIDTVIVHPDDRRTNIQVRADLKVSFESTSDFPTPADFRKGGLTARAVDTSLPATVLRGADRLRSGGSAEEDVDYCVISKDIIDFNVDVSCYMRLRTARPRAFLKEQGEPLRAIG